MRLRCGAVGHQQQQSRAARSQPVPRNLSIQRRDRMSNRQDMMRHRRTSTDHPFAQPETITGRSAGVLLTVDDQDRRVIQSGRQISPETEWHPPGALGASGEGLLS